MKQSKSRGRLLIVIAIGLALLTCISILLALSPEERVNVIRVKKTLSKPIPARTVIDDTFLQAIEEISVPLKTKSTSAIGSKSQLEGYQGLITLIELRPGDIVEENQIEFNKGNPTVSGKRTISLGVDQVTSVGGAVKNGDFVDVIVSYEQDDGTGKKTPRTILLLQNVPVVAVFINSTYPGGQYSSSSSGSSSTSSGPQPARFTTEGSMIKDTTVTLLLSVPEAMQLAYMANFAKEVRLVLRNPNDPPVQPFPQPIDPKSFK